MSCKTVKFLQYTEKANPLKFGAAKVTQGIKTLSAKPDKCPGFIYMEGGNILLQVFQVTPHVSRGVHTHTNSRTFTHTYTLTHYC